MEQSDFSFRRNRDIGGVLNATFTFIRQEFKPFIKVIAYFSGPFILIGAISLGLYQKSIFALPGGGGSSILGVFGVLSSVFNEEYFISIFFLVLGQVMLITSVYAYAKVYDEFGRNNFTFQDVWTVVKKNFLKIAGALFVIYLIVGIGLVLLIIPGIYLIIATLFILPAMIIHKYTFAEAFNRSFFLVKNNWWITFGIMLLISMIIYFARAIFTLPQMVISMFFVTNSIEGDNNLTLTILMIVFTAISTLGSYLLLAVPYVGSIVQYYSLIEQKESPELLKRIRKINQTDEEEKINSTFPQMQQKDLDKRF